MIIPVITAGRFLMEQARARFRAGGRSDRQSRRAVPRFRVLKGAKVRIPGGLPIKCIVRDLSTSGAQIERRGPIMSEFFRLSFDDPSWPQEVPCVVVWRDNDIMGVKFETQIAIPENLPASE
jgi:hypothetical protein